MSNGRAPADTNNSERATSQQELVLDSRLNFRHARDNLPATSCKIAAMYAVVQAASLLSNMKDCVKVATHGILQQPGHKAAVHHLASKVEGPRGLCCPVDRARGLDGRKLLEAWP